MISRRQFAVGVGAGLLSACCTRDYPMGVSESLVRAASAVPEAPVSWLGLVSSVRSATSPDSAMHSCVDAHAHFFNASDVPVRDYLGKSIAHTQNPIVRELLKLLAYLADGIAQAAPSARAEMSLHQAGDAQMRGIGTREGRALWRERVVREDRAAAGRVADVVRKSRFLKRYGELTASRGVRAAGGGGRQGPMNDITAQEVLDVVERGRKPIGQALIGVEPREAQDARAAEGVLGFLFYMLSLRACNIDAHRRQYAERSGAVRAVRAVGALVDFDYWLNCPPVSSHQDQIALHAYLSGASGGYMKPLVGYNPWTDIVLDGEALSRAQDAVMNCGFAGVKIYPPTGFYPADNAGQPFPTKEKRPDLNKLDDVLDTFFSWCEDAQVVVMAHANRSAGRDDKHDELSSPQAWARRLDRHEKPLRINLGHIGGGNQQDWTEQFVQLMATYSRHRVYGDIGYWDELMEGCAPSEDCSPAKRRLLHACNYSLGNGETGADRLLYGTDWLMLSRVANWPEYQNVIAGWLRRSLGDTTADKLLEGNAHMLFDARLG